MVASLQDLKFEMLPPNIQAALKGFGISSTGDMRAMYDKYKDSPTMLNMGMQMIGLTPAAVDQIVAQAGAKQQAAAASASPTKAAAVPSPPAKVAAPAQAPVRAAISQAPQPRVAAPQRVQRASTMPDVAPPPSAPVATPDGEEGDAEQADSSVNQPAPEEPIQQAETTTHVDIPSAPQQDAVAGEDEFPAAIEPAGGDDSEGVDAAPSSDAASAASPSADQDAAIEQLIANGRQAGVSGDGDIGAGTMASRAMPRGVAARGARGGGGKQAVMDDIVSQMMAQNAAQQQMPPGMPPAGPQAPQMPPRATRPPPPIAQKSDRAEEMISNLVRGARGKSNAQSRRGAPTGGARKR